jgi:hypothetical protein
MKPAGNPGFSLLIASCCAILLHAPSAAAATLFEDFSGPALNGQWWSTWNADANQDAAQLHGQLEVTVGAASVGPYFGAGITTNFLVKGDFEMIADYTLVAWPNRNGVRAGIRFIDPAVTGQTTRQSGDATGPQSNEIYLSNFQDGFTMDVATSVTADGTGRLKLQRVGSVTTGFFFNAGSGSWQTLGSHDYLNTGGLPEWLRLDVSAWSHSDLTIAGSGLVHPFAGQEVRVAFDNVQITYETMSAVPMPAPVWLLVPGLGLVVARRRFGST